MSEDEKTTNIVEHRRNFLVELKQQIDIAYKNRKKTYIHPEKNTAEAITKASEERAKINSALIDKTDEEVFVDTGEFTPLPNAVYVANSHEYPDLIRMSLEKLADECYYNRGDISKTTRSILEHEFEHHVPALGQDGLDVRYCVEFLESNQESWVGISPAIRLTGRFTVKLYKEIIKAATAPSATDKILG